MAAHRVGVGDSRQQVIEFTEILHLRHRSPGFALAPRCCGLVQEPRLVQGAHRGDTGGILVGCDDLRRRRYLDFGDPGAGRGHALHRLSRIDES